MTFAVLAFVIWFVPACERVLRWRSLATELAMSSEN
jgi:hypothetical protein